MSPTEPTAIDRQPGCSLCARKIERLDSQAVFVTVGRSDAEVWDDEPVYRETQELRFCDLSHANQYLAQNPIADEWTKVETDDGVGVVGAIGCAVVALILLVTGLIVVAETSWRIVT